MPRIDDDIELVPIPLDRETRALLVRFSAACGEHPCRKAAELLRDLLLDDDAAHPHGTMN